MSLNILKPGIDHIFNIRTSAEFKELALAVFRYQASENEVYHNYLNALKINPESVLELEQIPFLPIEFFKTHKISIESGSRSQESRSKNQDQNGSSLTSHLSHLFTSTGTTGMIQSKHYVSDVSIYEKSYRKGFDYFYGNIEDYVIFALLPSYLEREGSSLIYMTTDLIKKSKHPQSGFYLHNYDELISVLKQVEQKKQRTILLGVTYALLDLAELNSHFERELRTVLKSTIIMETGGMKGKRKEMVREELHTVLSEGFGVDVIHSEYGMTELLSQAYSKGNGIFNCPPWMKVMIRDTNDPFSFLSQNKTGGINVIDLANINSCSFIATQDLGRCFSDDSFEVLGRFDNSDIRGCNMLVQ